MAERGAITSSLAAVASVLLASSCCLPVGVFLGAAWLAGASVFLAGVRPYLLILSVALLGFGYFRAFRARHCDRRQRRLRVAVLVCPTVLVAASLLVPQGVAGMLGGGGRAPAAQPPLASLDERAFRQAFNAAGGLTRAVVLLSPT